MALFEASAVWKRWRWQGWWPAARRAEEETPSLWRLPRAAAPRKQLRFQCFESHCFFSYSSSSSPQKHAKFFLPLRQKHYNTKSSLSLFIFFSFFFFKWSRKASLRVFFCSRIDTLLHLHNGSDAAALMRQIFAQRQGRVLQGTKDMPENDDN